jgi:hypothetical protein
MLRGERILSVCFVPKADIHLNIETEMLNYLIVINDSLEKTLMLDWKNTVKLS